MNALLFGESLTQRYAIRDLARARCEWRRGHFDTLCEWRQELISTGLFISRIKVRLTEIQ